MTGDPDVLCTQNNTGHSVVNHCNINTIDGVFGLTAGQKRPAAGTCRVLKGQRNRSRRPGNTINACAAFFVDLSVWSFNACHGCLPRIFHENADLGRWALRFYKTARDRKGANTCQKIAAVLRVGYQRCIHRDLQKKIINIDGRSIGFSHNSNF